MDKAGVIATIVAAVVAILGYFGIKAWIGRKKEPADEPDGSSNKSTYRIGRVTWGGNRDRIHIKVDYINDDDFWHTIENVQLKVQNPEYAEISFEQVDETESYRGNEKHRDGNIPPKEQRKVKAYFNIRSRYESDGFNADLDIHGLRLMERARSWKFRLLLNRSKSQKPEWTEWTEVIP